jgi:hypothetical protein
MAWVSERNLDFPDNWREPLNLFTTMCLVIVTTNATMEVGYIRHRWRKVLFASRMLALTHPLLATRGIDRLVRLCRPVPALGLDAS